MEPHEQQLEDLADLIRQSNQILVFTGAGISTGSGIPDFRGPQGIWKKRQPIYYDDFMQSEPARREYWDYKVEGWKAFENAKPNAAHDAIVKIEQANRLIQLVTQNVDGLHGRAGTSSEKMVEIHGTNSHVECQSCRRISDPAAHVEYFRAENQCPTCDCGGYLKFGTISFGQSLRQEDLARATQAAQEADLAIALGSTLSVYPAADIPHGVATRGKPYVIINQGATDHDYIPQLTLRLEGDVSDLFPKAVDRALNSSPSTQ